MVLNIISVISAILSIIILILFITQIVKTGRFIDKKSAIILAPTFINVFILYFFGIYYTNPSIINSLFYALQYSVLAFALRFNFEYVEVALTSCKLYYLVFYVGIGLTALCSVLVIVAYTLGKFINKLKCLILKDEPLILIGFNDDTVNFYNSLNRKSKVYFMIESYNESPIKYCLTNNIKYIFFNEENINKITKKRFIYFISFLDDESSGYDIINLFNKINRDYNLRIITKSSSNDVLKSLTINNDKIDVFSIYDLVIKKFILEYQVANLLTSNQINYNTATLYEDINITNFIYGFSDLGNKLYLDLIENGQFVKLKNNKYENYVPSYLIFDENTINESNYNIHNLHHIDEITQKEDYFPLPNKIENSTFFENTNLKVLYKELDKIIEKSKKNDMIIFYFVSSSEGNNVDLGFKVLQKLKEKEVSFDYRIFIYANENLITETYSNHDERLIIFGCEHDIINYEVIVEDSLDEYAKRRAYYYDLIAKNKVTIEGLININNNKKIIKEKNALWNSLGNYQKKSNVKSVLSIMSKMAMLGLEITDDKENAITESEYLNIYDENHCISENTTYFIRNKKNISKRDALAFLEHQRWNAFMICDGYIPMKKSKIEVSKENDKIKLYKNDTNLRLHACITTFDGLEEYFDFMAKKFEEENIMSYDDAFLYVENKKYDYMLMDTAYNDIRCLKKSIKKKY